MTKRITNLDAFDLFFESGTARLRLKGGLTLENLLDARLEKRKIPTLEMHAFNRKKI
mgnify:CR=1 FL=1